MVRMPETHEPLSVPRAHQLRQGAFVTVLECETGLTYQGKVLQSWKGAHVDVEFGNKHVATFMPETDGMEPNVDCIVSPQDGFMLVTRKAEHEATPDVDFMPALAASVQLAKLATRVLRAETAISVLNNRAQSEVSRDEFNGLVDMVGALRDEIATFRRVLQVKKVS